MANKQSIFYGNGFNYLIKGFPSWSSLVAFDNQPFKNSEIPYTIQFEIKLMKNAMGDIMLQDDIEKKKLQGSLIKAEDVVSEESEGINLYRRIINLHADNYLTTNYDNILFNYYRKVMKVDVMEQKRPKDHYSIERYYRMKTEKSPYIWNIHGDYKKYPSMIIGYNHYCGSIGQMDKYLKGHYEYVNKNGEKVKNMPIIRRLIDQLLNPDKAELNSWIDRFFTDDVHIIGLGLPFDEIDIWWLLNYRQRLKSNPKLADTFENRLYYYEAYTPKPKRIALENMGVTVVNSVYRLKDDYSNSYQIYNELLDKMKENFDNAEKTQ